MKFKLKSPIIINKGATDVRLLASHIDLNNQLRNTFDALSLDTPLFSQNDILYVIYQEELVNNIIRASFSDQKIS